MPRNFDTTNGLDWPRVAEIKIEFDEKRNGSAEYVERLAVTVEGKVRYLEDPKTYHRIEIPFEDMQNPVPMVDPVTGADIGQTTSGHQLYMVLMAFVRADQKARDAE
jgi:hypothetical protein